MGRTLGVMLGITGATGALGGRVAAQLADRNPVLIVRNLARAPKFGQARAAGYGDADAARAALAGVDTLLMVSAAEAADRRDQHRTFIAAAAEAGVRHLVYTSFVGAAPDATFTLGRDHHDAEQAIVASGMSYTFLRDNFYQDVLPLFADPDGAIRGPAGDGRVGAVARADVADVAAAVLVAPNNHRAATYNLTGPEALSLNEFARRAGAVLGRTFSYHPETVDEAYAARRAAYPDAAPWQLDAWVSTYTAIADGSVDVVTDDVATVLGRPARTLEQGLGGPS